MTDARAMVEVSEPAEDDLAKLLVFTEARWGIEKRREYDAAFSSIFGQLSYFPESGTALSDIRSELRSILCQQHRVYYRFHADTVLILRILHVRQDLSRVKFDE